MGWTPLTFDQHCGLRKGLSVTLVMLWTMELVVTVVVEVFVTVAVILVVTLAALVAVVVLTAVQYAFVLEMNVSMLFDSIFRTLGANSLSRIDAWW
jgi:hypothetical protein